MAGPLGDHRSEGHIPPRRRGKGNQGDQVTQKCPQSPHSHLLGAFCTPGTVLGMGCREVQAPPSRSPTAGKGDGQALQQLLGAHVCNSLSSP